MVYSVSITSQGQISIPAKIRRTLGLKKRGRALVSEEDGKIIVKPVVDFFDLKGSIKTNKPPLTNDQIHEIFGEAMSEEYAQSQKSK